MSRYFGVGNSQWLTWVAALLVVAIIGAAAFAGWAMFIYQPPTPLPVAQASPVPSSQNMGSPVQGWEYAGEITEQQQADYIVRAYQMGKSWGWVGVMFLWNLDVAPWLGKDHEAAKYCIVYPNWAGRPAFAALANMPK